MTSVSCRLHTDVVMIAAERVVHITGYCQIIPTRLVCFIISAWWYRGFLNGTVIISSFTNICWSRHRPALKKIYSSPGERDLLTQTAADFGCLLPEKTVKQ